MKFSFANHEFIADPAGALFWPARRTLIVADLHLEKGSAFGQRGQFLPPYDSAETLMRLRHLVQYYDAARTLALGDNIHDAGGWDRLEPQARVQLAALAAETELVFLYGNHDRLQVPPVGEALSMMTQDGLIFTHEPELHELPTLAGHLHPCVTLYTQAGRQRSACFYVAPRLLILPAFGAYTGGLDVTEGPFHKLHDPAVDLLICGRQSVHSASLQAYQASSEKPLR